MSDATFEYYCDRDPDHIEGSPEHVRRLQLWMPDEEYGGLAVLDTKLDGQPNEGPSPYDGIRLIQNIESAARTLRHLTDRLPTLYNYLGVTVSRTAEQIMVGFPHGETLVRRLGALPLADDQRPPGFTLQSNGLYSAKTCLEQLAHNQSFTMAANGPYAVHDLLTHALSAQILVPPQGMTTLSANAKATLELEDETAISKMMDELDGNFSASGYGLLVADALIPEERTVMPDATRLLRWKQPVHLLDPRDSSKSDRPLAVHTLAYCRALNDAPVNLR